MENQQDPGREIHRRPLYDPRLGALLLQHALHRTLPGDDFAIPKALDVHTTLTPLLLSNLAAGSQEIVWHLHNKTPATPPPGTGADGDAGHEMQAQQGLPRD